MVGTHPCRWGPCRPPKPPFFPLPKPTLNGIRASARSGPDVSSRTATPGVAVSTLGHHVSISGEMIAIFGIVVAILGGMDTVRGKRYGSLGLLKATPTLMHLCQDGACPTTPIHHRRLPWRPSRPQSVPGDQTSYLMVHTGEAPTALGAATGLDFRRPAHCLVVHRWS